jgi:hypothetical protein
MKIIEWFFSLFFKNKAQILKQEVIFERQKAIADYEKVKKANEKYLNKYSGKKRYVKS